MRTRTPRQAIAALLARIGAALAALSLSVAQAASVLPVTFDGLVDGAAVAFQGRVLENRSELDRVTGHVVTFTTFEVEEGLKGSLGARHVIKQLGGQVGNTGYRIDGIPRFDAGGRYVVFLYGVSQAGFSSPVGLVQGRFMIRAGGAGLQVSNGRDFREMLQPIPAAVLPGDVRTKLAVPAERIEQLELESFKRLVRERVAR